jgi:DNA-binding winged helix-turn-helix (wHTH) protein/Tfp pilus assembly protein PilF
VPERIFQLLLALIEGNGRLVERDEIAQRVWGADGVTDANLTQHVYRLRELLGERRGQPGHILTVPGRGYRLVAPVSAVPLRTEDLEAEASRNCELILRSNADVLRHYCRGAYLLDRRTASALYGAIDAFNAALAIDDIFVPAFIGRARAWALLGEYWHLAPRVAFEHARLNADRALELDPRSPAALSVLSEIQLCFEWNWSRARDTLDAALAYNSRLAFVRNNSAWFHLYRGEFDTAAREAREALLCEPASLPLQLLLARVALHSGQYSEALAAISNILDGDPTFVIARRFLALAHILDGRPDRAVEQISSSRGNPFEDAVYRLPMLACAYAKMAQRREAELAYGALRALAHRSYVGSWNLAVAAANCGREDEALHLLREAESQRSPALLMLPILPVFTALDRRHEFSELSKTVAA